MTSTTRSKLFTWVALRAAVAGAALVGALAPASAAPVWQETYDLSSTLADPHVYASDLSTLTATVTYDNQRAYNTSGSDQHMGMYFAWIWSYDSTGADTPLLWDNALQAFIGGGISMTVQRTDAATGSLLLGDIVGDTWIGYDWDPGYGETPIATEAAWNVPFFDLGTIAAGDFASYGIQLSLTFDDANAFADWDAHGSFYIGGLGVQAVPEPGSLALAGLALFGVALLRPRRA